MVAGFSTRPEDWKKWWCFVKWSKERKEKLNEETRKSIIGENREEEEKEKKENKREIMALSK